MKVVDLFANIGGQLGLCIGASVITIAELFELVWVISVNLCKRLTNTFTQNNKYMKN